MSEYIEFFLRVLGGLFVLFLLSLVYRAWLVRKFSKLPAPEDVAAPPEDALEHEQGLRSKVLLPSLREPAEESPSVHDTVTVHYSGWTTDGKMFDSSIVRNKPATFPLKNVIKGWQLGIPLMAPGEKRRFWIPAELAYGERPRGGAPAGMLVFDVQLLGVVGRASS